MRFWILPFLYLCWLGMEAVHELGHVMHAVASGGTVMRVDLPLLGFSRTELRDNPHPLVVAWGGPVWGSLLPLIALALFAQLPPKWATARKLVQFFAGFCLIANGVYLGVGWIGRTGDAGDLLRQNMPTWSLIAFGAVACAAGLWLLHRLDNRAQSRAPSPVDR